MMSKLHLHSCKSSLPPPDRCSDLIVYLLHEVHVRAYSSHWGGGDNPLYIRHGTQLSASSESSAKENDCLYIPFPSIYSMKKVPGGRSLSFLSSMENLISCWSSLRCSPVNVPLSSECRRRRRPPQLTPQFPYSASLPLSFT